jgi:outer membrane protein TolC
VDEAAAALQQRWHGVVGEVEAALERLQAAAERRDQVDAAQLEWERIAQSAAQMSGAGLQSGPQRVATQRQALAALSAAQQTRHEHASAWVRLYRALGGGWQAEATDKH